MANYTTQKREYFVSREHELGNLHAIMHDVLGGRPRIVLIPGLSGQGKTTLVKFFLSDAQNTLKEKSLIAYGICSNPTSPFHVWYDALAYALKSDAFIEEPDNLSENKSEIIFGILKKFAPELLENIVSNLTGGWSDTAVLTYNTWTDLQSALRTGQVRKSLYMGREESSDSPAIQNNILIRSQFEQLTKVGLIPIIFLDDLQLADKSSLYLILELAKNSSNNINNNWPYMLILSYRSNEIRMRRGDADDHEFRSIEKELCTNRYSQVVTSLFGLRKSLPDNPPGISIQSYVNKRFVRHQLSEDFLYLVSDWTRGEAQFVHELFNLWQLNGKIRRNLTDKSWFLDGEIDLREYANKDMVIVQRVELLVKNEKEVLTRASVDAFSDDLFIQQVIARTFQDKNQDISLEIRSLRDEHRLIEFAPEVMKQSSTQIFETYRFSHSLISHVAYDRLLENETRRRLHIAIAEEIINLFSNSIDGMLSEIAFHYSFGGNYILAAVYYLRLLDLRIKQRQYYEAKAVHLKLVQLEGKPLSLDESLEVNFSIILSTAMMTRIDNEQSAAEFFNKLLSMLEISGIYTAAIRARFFEQYDKHLYYLGKANRAFRLKAIEEYMEANEPDSCIDLMIETAESARLWGLYKPTLDLIMEIELWLKGKDYWRIYASKFLIAKSKLIVLEKGGRLEARIIRQQALDLARISGDNSQLFEALNALSQALGNLGEIEESILLAEEALALAEKTQRVDWELVALFRCLSSQRIIGNETESHRLAEKRIAIAEEIGSLGILSSAINTYGFGLSFFGHKKQALEAYNRAREVNLLLGRTGYPLARHNRAAMLVYFGNFDEAREEFKDLLRIGQETRNFGRYSTSLMWLGKLDYHQWYLHESEKNYLNALKLSKGELLILGNDEPSPYRNRKRVFRILRELALVYTRMGKCKKALEVLSEIDRLQIDDPDPNVNDQNLYLSVKGFVFGKCGEFNLGLKILEEAIVKLSKQGRGDKQCEAQLYYAELLEKANPELSIKLALELLNHTDETEAYWYADVCYLIGRLIKPKGDDEKALDFLHKAHQKYSKMRVIHLIEETKNLINEWET